MIWYKKSIPSVKELNERGENTLFSQLDMEITSVTENSISAKMPVSSKNAQPIGILNGGASVALAESIASCAANYCVNFPKQYCVGLEINANHLRPAKLGETVVATATPVHMGRKTQVWSTEIKNTSGKLTCICRFTIAVLDKE